MWKLIKVLFFILFCLYIDKSLCACGNYNAHYINKKASIYENEISDAANNFGVNKNLIKAVIAVESCFNDKALSPKGAAGLMQLMPSTATRFGVVNRFNPSENIIGGTKYIKFLLARYNKSLNQVFAAYNAGEGNVDTYNGNIPPFKETQNYVKNVLIAYNNLSINKNSIIDIDSNYEVEKFKNYKNMKLLPLISLQPPKAYFEPSNSSCNNLISNKILLNTQKRGSIGNYIYYYKIKPTDTFEKIKGLLGVSASDIALMNNLTIGVSLPVGRWIKVAECIM